MDGTSNTTAIDLVSSSDDDDGNNMAEWTNTSLRNGCLFKARATGFKRTGRVGEDNRKVEWGGDLKKVCGCHGKVEMKVFIFLPPSCILQGHHTYELVARGRLHAPGIVATYGPILFRYEGSDPERPFVPDPGAQFGFVPEEDAAYTTASKTSVSYTTLSSKKSPIKPDLARVAMYGLVQRACVDRVRLRDRDPPRVPFPIDVVVADKDVASAVKSATRVVRVQVLGVPAHPHQRNVVECTNDGRVVVSSTKMVVDACGRSSTSTTTTYVPRSGTHVLPRSVKSTRWKIVPLTHVTAAVLAFNTNATVVMKVDPTYVPVRSQLKYVLRALAPWDPAMLLHTWRTDRPCPVERLVIHVPGDAVAVRELVATLCVKTKPEEYTRNDTRRAAAEAVTR